MRATVKVQRYKKRQSRREKTSKSSPRNYRDGKGNVDRIDPPSLSVLNVQLAELDDWATQCTLLRYHICHADHSIFASVSLVNAASRLPSMRKTIIRNHHQVTCLQSWTHGLCPFHAPRQSQQVELHPSFPECVVMGLRDLPLLARAQAQVSS